MRKIFILGLFVTSVSWGSAGYLTEKDVIGVYSNEKVTVTVKKSSEYSSRRRVVEAVVLYHEMDLNLTLNGATLEGKDVFAGVTEYQCDDPGCVSLNGAGIFIRRNEQGKVQMDFALDIFESYDEPMIIDGKLEDGIAHQFQFTLLRQ